MNKKERKDKKRSIIRAKKYMKKYGKWVCSRGWSGEISTPVMFTAVDYMPKGWWRCFGDMMFTEMSDAIKKAGAFNDLNYYPTEIKEKYGSLRIYMSYYIPEVEEIIDKYSYISENCCIFCGKPDTAITSDYWIVCECEECYKKYSNSKREYAETHDTNPENCMLQTGYSIMRNDKKEYIDISETSEKVRQNWHKRFNVKIMKG